MIPIRSVALLSAVVLLAGCAGSRPDVSAPPASAASASKSKTKSVADATKGSIRHDGLLTLFRDSTSGSMQMLITPEQVGEQLIYVVHVTDGIPRGGSFRGQYRDNRVFTIRRFFDRVEFVAENDRFYFDEDNAVSRAADANMTESILAVQKIVAEDSTGILIDADGIFLSESLARIQAPRRPGTPPTAFALGRLSKEKTKITDLRAYPENTDVVVQYVYDNPDALNPGGSEVADARSTAISVQHSFIALPAVPMEPLMDDPRVGYFTTERTDLTSASVTPYRDMVHRWRLVKQNPGAAMSDPVTPITFWIENTTPVEYRDVVRRAALQWNLSFEKAGFSNALVIEQQPDDADWEAGDVRYNVLRWTSSPTPPFGGYGPSYVDPRTGEIIGSDIMLEYSSLIGAKRNADLYDDAMGLSDAHDHDAWGHKPWDCGLLAAVAGETALAQVALAVRGAGPMADEALVEEFLYFLVLHEIGHTLGLNHNMKASQMLSPTQVHDASLTRRVGLVGSVMDYPAVNVAPPGVEQGEYYITRPGPYDDWAIRFAYQPMSETERDALLARSTEPELAFGNDADDMRAPGKAIDPRVMVNDLSSDAIAYAQGRFALVESLMDDLMTDYRANRQGQSYDELRRNFGVLMGQISRQTGVVSRYVGGVYVDRAFVGQPGETQPYTPVDEATQRRAVQVLTDYLFAPDAFEMDADLLAALQPQRRGYNFFASGEDPRLHDQVLGMQAQVLAHLLHPNTLERVTDSRLYGNTYTLTEIVDDLVAAGFEADRTGPVNTFRQNLQIAMVEGMIGIVADERDRYDALAQTAALYGLRQIEEVLDARRGDDSETVAHAMRLDLLIDRALKTD